MSKKAEIKLGISTSEAKNDAKKVNQVIKQELTKDLNVPIKADTRQVESAIERVKRAEAERAAKSVKNTAQVTSAELAALKAVEDVERRKVQAAEKSAARRVKTEAEVVKKLEGMQKVMGNYDKLSSQYPTAYRGTKSTAADAHKASQSAEYVKNNVSSLSDKEITHLQKSLSEISYRDLATVRGALSKLSNEVAHAVATQKKFTAASQSLDRMKTSIDNVANAMDKAVKKIMPTADTPKKETDVAIQAANAVKKTITGTAVDGTGRTSEISYGKLSPKLVANAAGMLSHAMSKIQPSMMSSQLPGKALTGNTRLPIPNMEVSMRDAMMSTLDHFQRNIDKTRLKGGTGSEEKVDALRNLQYRLGTSAILTADMTSEQLGIVRKQMERMSSNTLREMQRGMNAIDKMFTKMAREAEKQANATPVLNYEKMRQAGEKNLQTGVYRPSARSDTSDEAASRMIKLLEAPKMEKQLMLPEGRDAILDLPFEKLQAGMSRATKSTETFSAKLNTVTVEMQRKNIENWASNNAKNERGWEADYTGPVTRKRAPQLLLGASPQEQLSNIFGKIDMSALDKLANRISRGEVVNAKNVPGGVASASAAPDQLRGIIKAVPQLTNEMSHALLKATQGLKFDTLENSINGIERTFQEINSLLSANAKKYSVSATEEKASRGIPITPPATSLDALRAQMDAAAAALQLERNKRVGQDNLANSGATPGAPENKDLIARQAAAQQQLIEVTKKVMAAFDKLSTKVANDPNLSATEKEQWSVNARGITSAARRVESTSSIATPEAIGKATKILESSDINDAVKLRANLESIASTLGKSKATLLKEMNTNMEHVGRGAAKVNTNLKSVIQSITQANRASQFLNNTTQNIEKNAKKLERTYKDVSRVVQGIMISRIFYTGLQQVTAMTSAVGQMIVQYEQAHMAMSVMLKDYEQASRMMTQLSDFAAKTPLTNQQADKAAQMLLAYGFEAKNLMPVMRDLADATAAIGNPQAFESIARALGQINTKGKLSAEELRQLTEQGIPALDIIREKLNLTEKQVANIGRAGITSDQAISALLAGIQERYGGAADALSKTTGGMMSTISDNILLAAREILQPMKNVFDGVLNNMVTSLNKSLSVLRESGVGGLFEHLIPPELHEAVRILAANLNMLIGAFTKLWGALAPVGQLFAHVAVIIGNTLLPIISVIVIALANFINMLASCTWFMRGLTAALAGFAIGWVVTKIVALMSMMFLKLMLVIKGVVAIVQLLIKGQLVFNMVASLTVGKVAIIVGAFLALIAVVAALTGHFDGFFNSFSKGIQSMFKIDSSKYFQKTMTQNADVVGEFGEEFDANGEKIDSWGDKVKDNAKKARDAVMSFDEVFNLTDETDSGAGDETEGFAPDMDIPDIAGGMFPDIPDTSIDWDDFFDLGNFMDNFEGLTSWFADLGKYFTKSYWESLKDGSGGLWDILMEGSGEVLGGIGGIFSGIAEMIAGLIMFDLPMLSEGWWRMWHGCGEILEGLGTIVEWVFKAILDCIDGFLNWLFGDAWEGFKRANSNIGDAFAELGEGISTLWTGLIDFLLGIITLDFQRFADGWCGIIDGLGLIISGSVKAIVGFFQNIIDYLLGDFLLNFGFVGEFIAGLLDSARIMIGKIIDNIIGIFQGIIDFIVGVFTGDWERAWDGVVAIFTGILSAIGNVFVGIMNMIIDTVNWCLRQINKISVDVPDWLPEWAGGGSTFGLNIPLIGRIPYFAEGGLISKATLGVVGEAGEEGILPLTNDKAMARIAAAITEQMPPPTGTPGGTTTLNVGVLVADERSLRQLQEMLDEANADR